jgi:hypothetical protein
MIFRHTTITTVAAVPFVLALGAIIPAWASSVQEVRRMSVCCALGLTFIGCLAVLYVLSTVVRSNDELSTRMRKFEAERTTQEAISDLEAMSDDELSRAVDELSEGRPPKST